MDLQTIKEVPNIFFGGKGEGFEFNSGFLIYESNPNYFLFGSVLGFLKDRKLIRT